MSKFGISIVIPSIGRPHLAKVLDVLQPQLTRDDEIIVIADRNHRPIEVQDIVDGRPSSWKNTYCFVGAAEESWLGCREIDSGIMMASKPWLWIVADDDLPATDALVIIRRNISESLGNYDKPHGFAVIDRFHELRHFGTLDQNKICAPNIVWPLHLGKDRMPKCWDGKREYWTDWRFNLRGVAEFGAPVWHDEVVYYVERVK